MNANGPRLTRRAWIVTALFVLGILLPQGHSALCAEPQRGSMDFERIDIPADQPALWPKEIERLEAVPWDEFISLYQQNSKRERDPRSASLTSVHYEATLVNDSLRGGLMTASVQRLNGRVTLLELGKFSFALENLKWQDRAAIWGTAADGRSWVVTSDSHDELLGEWSCRGRKIPGGVDFDLQLPQSTISFLDLRAPRDFSVSAPGANVTLLSDMESESTKLWRIHCGSEARCRITFVKQEGVEPSRQTLVVESEMQVTVREEDLRFQLSLRMEALDAPVQEIVLRVPADLEIYSAVYGADNPVSLRRANDAEKDGRWVVQLPGPLTGRRRILRIEGISAQKPGQDKVLPQVIVENSIFDGGHLALKIQAPLEVRSLRANGYRQRPSDGEQRLVFEQLAPNAQLILGVHRSPVSLSGQSTTLLSVETDSWNLTSEITWKSLKGGGYKTACLLPADWEIAEVRLKTDDEVRRTSDLTEESPRTSESPKMNWEVESYNSREVKLSIEFLEVIPQGQSRTVRILAHRRTPQMGSPVAIPTPQLLNCEISETFFGILIPNTMSSVFSQDSQLERIAKPDFKSFALSFDVPNSDLRWYRGDSIESMGTLQIAPRLQPVDVRAETIIEALPSEYRTRYSIHFDKSSSQTDRLLVFLTENETDVRWTWKGTPTIELSAVRLSKVQHGEWNLPATGELWEIRLPRSIRESGSIEGIATNRWSATNHPALLFIPQSAERRVDLSVTHQESLALDLEIKGLIAGANSTSWWYATPQVELGISLKNPLPSREFPLMVSMELRTLMSAAADGSDLYRARLQLENGSPVESLRIKLDPTAVVQEALVGGESIAATYQGGEFVIPGLNVARRDTVEISYRVPAHSTMLYERRRIVVPQVSAQVLGFFWEFSVPPSTRIFAEPAGVQLSRRLPSLGWTERFFGPLGRASNEPIFNPLSKEAWMHLIQPAPTMPAESGDELVVLHQAASPDLPLDLSVELWHGERIEILTWISLGLSLLLGIILRVIGWSHRDRFAAYALGFLFAAAFSLSSPYVGFTGGAIAGTLIALLIPRHLFRRVDPATDLTVEYRQLEGAVVAFLVGATTFMATAFSSPSQTFAQEPLVEEAGKRPRVYIPVDRNDEPSSAIRLVYVSRDAWERWKTATAEFLTRPSYLISSAKYELRGTSDPTFNLVSKFRVHVLASSTEPVAVQLPLSDMILPDIESCRVNQMPHPVASQPNGKGYTIELLPHAEPVQDESKPESNDEGARLRYVTYEIELLCRRNRIPGAPFDLRIPPVANSEFVFYPSEPTPFVDISGGLGTTEQRTDSKLVTSSLGTTSNVQVRWGQVVPSPKPARITASLLEHLEIQPAYSDLFFHFTAEINEGSLDSLDFELPPNAIVRKDSLKVFRSETTDSDAGPASGIVRKDSFKSEELLRSDTIVTASGERRLRLVFGRSLNKNVTIDGVLLLLQPDAFAQSQLPRFGLVRNDGLLFSYDRNWWGISAPPDFQLNHSNLDPENVTAVPLDEYLAAWDRASETRRHESIIPSQPQATFEMRDGTIPSFQLVPFQPRRRATQWKQTGVIGRNRLDWTLVGEIETTHSPTFQIALLVDRRLRIEEISVKENDAERLNNRWTESRSEVSRGDFSRVVLFLNNRAQGKQTITLRGSMNLVPGTPVSLPSVRAEDCETLNPRVTLMHDLDVDVAFTLPSAWKQISNDEQPAPVPGRTNSPLIQGTYVLNDFSQPGVIQTSSRHARCFAHSIVFLRRSIEGSSWRMKYRMVLTPEGDSALRLGLDFPPSFTDMDTVTVSRAEPAWQHDVQDGARHLDLLLNRTEGAVSAVMQFESNLVEPTSGDWVLPLPTPRHAINQETLVVIEPDTVWTPKNGREGAWDELPDWVPEFSEDISLNRPPTRVTGSTIELQRVITATEVREPAIRLLDQRMWMHRDGRRSGITQAFISSMQGELEFTLPRTVVVTSIFLDDRALPLTLPSDGRLKISMSDAGNERLLTITWKIDANSASLPRHSTEMFLWPRDIPIDKSLVTLLPEQPTYLWMQSGMHSISELDQSMDLLETLLDRHAALTAETRGSMANRWLIDRIQQRIKSELPKEFGQRHELLRRHLHRWTELVNRINQLERVPPAPAISWHTRLLEEPVTEGENAIRGRTDQSAHIRVVRFNLQFWKAIGSGILALILVAMFRRTIRIEWSDWLHRHVAMSWLLLSIVWWVFLTPSVLGSCLMIVALVRAMTQYGPSVTPGAPSIKP